MYKRLVFGGALLVLGLVSLSDALICYYCGSSTSTFYNNCREPFNATSVPALPCGLAPSDATFRCLTVTTHGNNPTTYSRSCSLGQQSNTCETQFGVKTCYNFCTTDLCNTSGGFALTPKYLFMLIPAVLARLLVKYA